MASATTINNAIEKYSERRKAVISKQKHDSWERKHKLIPFQTKDGKTTFLVKTKAQGEKRLAEYERKQKIYIGL